MRKIIGRLLASASVAVLSLILSAVPASAVLNGTLDSSNIYSNVGMVIMNGQHWCSGTLYRTDSSQTSSNLFLTAAHCVLGYSGPFSVTFDPSGSLSSTAIPGTAYAIPGFAYAPKTNNSLQQNNFEDAAVIVLDHAPAGITPADLPSLGLVDTLNFKSQLITTVGYGIDDFSNANNPSIGPRNYKTVGISTGQRTQSANFYVKTDAGACSGDSGGPNFMQGTSTILGVTSWGQSVVCSDNNYFYRIDSADALNFLNHPTTVGVH